MTIIRTDKAGDGESIQRHRNIDARPPVAGRDWQAIGHDCVELYESAKPSNLTLYLREQCGYANCSNVCCLQCQHVASHLQTTLQWFQRCITSTLLSIEGMMMVVAGVVVAEGRVERLLVEERSWRTEIHVFKVTVGHACSCMRAFIHFYVNRTKVKSHRPPHLTSCFHFGPHFRCHLAAIWAYFSPHIVSSHFPPTSHSGRGECSGHA